jgi:membrane protease YdiL (CAAX protease family)
MTAPSARLLPLAVIGEGALALAGGVWIYVAGLPVRLGDPGLAVAAGVGVALGLGTTQWWLQRHAPRVGPVEYLRELQRTIFAPLFGPLSTAELVAISVLAGIGEEIFFRGAMQPALGWVPATLAFGLCHVGISRNSWVLGVWALAAGAGLAALLEVTGGLLAPIVAHAVYDLAALLWIRRDAHRSARPALE